VAVAINTTAYVHTVQLRSVSQLSHTKVMMMMMMMTMIVMMMMQSMHSMFSTLFARGQQRCGLWLLWQLASATYQSSVGVEVEFVDVESKVAPVTVLVKSHVTRRTFQFYLYHTTTSPALFTKL